MVALWGCALGDLGCGAAPCKGRSAALHLGAPCSGSESGRQLWLAGKEVRGDKGAMHTPPFLFCFPMQFVIPAIAGPHPSAPDLVENSIIWCRSSRAG